MSSRPILFETCPTFLLFAGANLNPRGIRLLGDVGWAMIVHSCKLLKSVVVALTAFAASTALLRIQLEVAAGLLVASSWGSFHLH